MIQVQPSTLLREQKKNTRNLMQTDLQINKRKVILHPERLFHPLRAVMTLKIIHPERKEKAKCLVKETCFNPSERK